MRLDDVQTEAARYERTAYLATVTPAGRPHVAPIAVAWNGDRLQAFVLGSSTKVRNLRANPAASVHYPVSAETGWDSLIVDGTASIVDTVDGRRALWPTMGYDLDPFEPGGPESDGHVFVVIEPTSALVLRRYGLDGQERWRA
ncbi:MAG: pyridoxamine 5'-phosphate oxidase family protein [Actinomycetota bacterium]